MPSRLLFLFAETPVHAGGSESIGVVDLPIQREASTTLPVVWGQSLKGALREKARAHWEGPRVTEVFGSPPPGEPTESTGAGDAGGADGATADAGSGEGNLLPGDVAVGDAQLLLFPAPTLTHTFAWVTSELLLSRLLRKFALADPALAAAWTVYGPDNTVEAGPTWTGTQVLGPFVQQIAHSATLPGIAAALGRMVCPDMNAFAYTRRKMTTDILLASNDVLTGLAETGTDVLARVQLAADSKTVANGPFYSEHLPAETVLAAVLTGTDKHLTALSELLHGKTMRLGGDETIGKGVLWCSLHDTAALRDILDTPADAPGSSTVPSDVSGPSAPPHSPGAVPSPAAMAARKAGS